MKRNSVCTNMWIMYGARMEDKMKLDERNDDLKSFFDMKADGYDNVHINFMESKKAITPALPDNTSRVLDLGGGTGLELIPLFERFPEAHVTVIDLSEKMLDRLKERDFSDRIRCVAGDFFEVDFGVGYNAVISTSALHHFLPEDKERLYRKIFDSLAVGGRFINADKCCENLEQQEFWFNYYETNPDGMLHVDTPLAIDNEVSILEKVGFSDISVGPLADENYYIIIALKK